MAKRRFHRVRHRFKRAAHKAAHPSLLSVAGLAIPQLAINTGLGGLGYNVFQSGASFSDRIRMLAVNESKAWLFYNPEVKQVDVSAGGFQYVGLFLPKILRLILGPKRVGKMTIW